MEETITIPTQKYQEIIKELELLRRLKNIDWDLVKQFRDSLEDVKEGRIRRVA